MRVICIIGASFLWTRTLVTDLMARFDEPLDIRFVDLAIEPAEVCRAWAEAASAAYGRAGDRFSATTGRRAALQGADAVLITISTGGLDAMALDIAIPERYGIFATVGDTAGPGGWSRSIRNIPVFMEFARDFREICPEAFIANYTNPMSALTATLSLQCGNPVSGFCHAYFETKDVIQHLFGLKDWSGISLEIAGMNHFTWVADFKIDGRDGYRLLRERIGGGSLRDLAPRQSSDELGIRTSHELFLALYEATGYLCYPADRHIGEFVPFALANWPALHTGADEQGIKAETTARYNIARTPIDSRRQWALNGRARMLEDTERLQESTGLHPIKSRETGADMIWGYLHNVPVVDAVNTLNRGQIAGLPQNACVETMGVVDGFGVRPVVVGAIPEYLLEYMRPQAVCAKWLVEGMLNGDKGLLMQALQRDPQCAALPPDEVRRMGAELLEANAPFLRGMI